MTEDAKVRLLRCPKCENLLPELPDFSLYQCGGCGAVLKGNTKVILEDGLLKPTNDLNGAGVSEETSILNAPVVEMETNDETENPRMKRIHNKVVAPDRTSTSRVESKDLPVDSDLNRRGKQRVGRLEHFDDDEYMSYPRGPDRYRNRGNNSDLNINKPEYANFRESRPPMESLRSRPNMDQWGPKSNGSVFPHRPHRPARGRYEYDDFLYRDEGSSSFDTKHYYEHGGRTGYQSHSQNGIAIENLENGRAELLRKLDELKDQLTHSCELAENPKERVGTDPYSRHRPVYVPEGLARSNGQPLLHDDMEARYLSQAPGYDPYRDRYPMRGYPHHINQPDTFRVPHQQPRSHPIHRPHPEHYSGYYDAVDHDLMMLHRHENLFHQPACSCLHCYNKNWDTSASAKVDHLTLHDRRARNEPPHFDFHHNLNHNLHGPQSYSIHPEHSRRTPIPNLSDQETENDGFNFHLPRKVALPRTNGKLLHPIAGGAPFVTCSNCFELLKLPKKHILGKKKLEMKCGACSSTILFELGNSGCVVSAAVHADEVPSEIDDGSSVTGDESARYWHGGLNDADLNALSNDYQDSEPKLMSIDNNPNSCGLAKQMDPISRASSLSENEQSPIKLSSEKLGSPSRSLDFPSQKFNENCSDNIVANRAENGTKSKRSEHERISDIGMSRQSSLKAAAVASEMDVSQNGCSNSCVSQDSVEITKENQSRGSKGGDSFFAGLIKKSFKKSNHKVEVGESQVYVNGHLIPARVVKKAEKLAGPIQPGDYWYDVEAGFWGVMGYPCMGIIMPNIEEFNYRMPEKCGAGNTGVYVNGRELNEKDLELLASRGLPITRHRSYTVEMSGKVVDDQTGEELDCLGKLAPTVEKAKHGFGMRVPKFITQA